MKPVQDKKDAVRDEILAAARGLFQNYGIDKTTMEDIAEAAGKGKSSLYYYFKTKEDVFCAVAQQEMASMTEALEKGLKSARTATEKVRLFFSVQDSALRSKAKLYPLVFRETKKHILLFQKLQRDANTQQTKLFKSILLEGIAAGEFRSISRAECDTIALTAVTTLHALQLNLILDGKTPSDEDKLEVMLDILVRGLR